MLSPTADGNVHLQRVMGNTLTSLISTRWDTRLKITIECVPKSPAVSPRQKKTSQTCGRSTLTTQSLQYSSHQRLESTRCFSFRGIRDSALRTLKQRYTWKYPPIGNRRLFWRCRSLCGFFLHRLEQWPRNKFAEVISNKRWLGFDFKSKDSGSIGNTVVRRSRLTDIIYSWVASNSLRRLTLGRKLK